MRPLFAVSLLALFTEAVVGIEFINPFQLRGASRDFSSVPVYAEGSTVIIQWTPGPEGNRTSLTLFQQNATTFLQPFEYLTQNVASSVTSFTWNVETNKDLGVSNTFFLSIFLEGRTSSEANSQFFNITAKDVAKPQSSTGTSTITSASSSSPTSTNSISRTIVSSPATSSSSAVDASTSSTASAAGLAPTSSSTVVPTESASGLSTEAKIGLGVGIPAAVLLGIAASWFIFGRRKKQGEPVPTTPAIYGPYEPEKFYPQTYRYQLSSESAVVPSTYELQGSHHQ